MKDGAPTSGSAMGFQESWKNLETDRGMLRWGSCSLQGTHHNIQERVECLLHLFKTFIGKKTGGGILKPKSKMGIVKH